MQLNTITTSDALAFLQALPDERVPMFLFSPPYNMGYSTGGGMRQSSATSSRWHKAALRGGYDDYDDTLPPPEYKAWQQQILAECWRCLPDDGAIFYNHKPRVFNGALQTPLDFNPGHLVLRQIIIWARGSGFNCNVSFYQSTHEWIVIFAKPDFRLKSQGASGAGDVWRINPETSTWHPAPFPMELAMRALETTMPALVCDPFSGSGTTARAAKRLGIDFIGCDRNESYVERANQELARERKMTVRQKTMADVIEEQAVLL